MARHPSAPAQERLRYDKVLDARRPHGREGNDEALDACEQRRADRRIEDACRFYAMGDERVEEAESD